MLHQGEQIGPYTLISKLGRGAFGTVWLSERRTTIATTTAALKIPIDDEVDLETIRQEANLWARASGHPNVLPIIEANVYDGQAIIASEYAPDGSLESWLKQNNWKAPSIESAVEIISGILAGLEHLHSRNIIHRDLKPANILFQGNTPRLADFGISRLLKSTSQSSIVAGTPAYMAPEAFDGKRNEQTDIWSAGVIFYQMLAGHLPFAQRDITSLVGAILSRNPDPLPITVPSPLQEIVTRGLAKDTRQRYRSVAEMRVDLRNPIANKSRSDARAVTTIQPPPVNTIPPAVSLSSTAKQVGNPRFIYAIAGALGILVVVLAIVILSRTSATNDTALSSMNNSTQNQRATQSQGPPPAQPPSYPSPSPRQPQPRSTTPRGSMLGGQDYGLYYRNFDNSLEEGVAYKFPNDNTTYIYDGQLLRPVTSAQAYFRFYGCTGNMRIIDCAPVYEMPSHVTSKMLEGEPIR